MSRCVLCGRDRGRRECPALGGLISPACCGQNRGVRVDCPPDCRYFREHEEYRRERLAPEFHRAWTAATEPLYRARKAEALDFLVFLELATYRYFLRETRGTDQDLLDALEQLARRLSPIQVIEAPASRLGGRLWEAAQEYQRRGRGVDPDEGGEAARALAGVVVAMSDAGEPRRALQGLLGHVEHVIGVPEGLKGESHIETPRIVYPGSPP